MEFNRQHNRPAQRVAPTAREATPQAPSVPDTKPAPSYSSYSAREEGGKKRGVKHTLVVSAIGLVLLASGYLLGNSLPLSAGGEISRVDTDKNQAVFLTNDQVYFGKIIDITDTAIVMEDIYYLQGAAQQNTATNQPASAGQQQTDMALTKLGNELHGPEDRMQINRDQVLFWENLKADGKVSEAIKSYKP